MTAINAMDPDVPPYLVIMGPTASGKSQLALELALVLGGEIVNCDSVQVYKDFNIGSAKPTSEERRAVPHHLLDVVAWGEDYDAARYAEEAQSVIREIARRGKLALVVGGSGLYLRSLWGERFHDLPRDPDLRAQLKARSGADLYQELLQRDPERAKEIHPHDHFRLARALEIVLLSGRAVKDLTAMAAPSFAPACVLMLDPCRQQLHAQIGKRTQAMLQQGLVDEVQAILAQGCPREAKVMQSIGYKQVAAYLANQPSPSQALLAEEISAASRQYAKRQLTWFRKGRQDICLRDPIPMPELRRAIRSFLPFASFQS